MTDSSGTVVWAADYKPFGEVTISVSTITNNLRFPGQYFDAETGTYYNYFRDYDPSTGKYKQADPIGQRGGLNLYQYVGNNPVNQLDYFGLAPKDKRFGLPDGFWRWYHRNRKFPGDPDLPNRSEAEGFYKEWQQLGKPGPDAKGGGSCDMRSKGARGPRGLKVLGVLQVFQTLLDYFDAQQRSEETGIDVWTIMNYEMQGREIITPADLGT